MITDPHELFRGVPACSIALIVYPVLIGPGFAALKRQKTRDVSHAASIVSAMGLMPNVVHVHDEIVYINAICILCVGSTVLVAPDLIGSISGYRLSAQ